MSAANSIRRAHQVLIALLAAFALVVPTPAPVAAAPSIGGCGQVDYGVIGFHWNDPGWIDVNAQHSEDSWFRWRFHGPGVDQVLYEGFMPRNEFETDGRIWGLKDGVTYYLEYWEIIPGYTEFRLDLIACTAQGTDDLPFGFDISIDGRDTTYPGASTVPIAKPRAIAVTTLINGRATASWRGGAGIYYVEAIRLNKRGRVQVGTKRICEATVTETGPGSCDLTSLRPGRWRISTTRTFEGSIAVRVRLIRLTNNACLLQYPPELREEAWLSGRCR